MKTYHILTGLPRSGSTVLDSILNQHPEIFVTPTSPMIELILSMKQICETNLAIKASFNEDQVDHIIKSISYSCWQHRSESIIIDKNRKWTEILLNSGSFETIFDNDTKVIYTDRDLPSIMASWATILQKTPENRAHHLSNSKTIDYALNDFWKNSLKSLLDQKKLLLENKSKKDRHVLFINYDSLINDAKTELSKIAEFLNLSSYDFQFEDIVNITEENDEFVWHLKDLHTIRPRLEKTCKHPKDVLGQILFDHYSKLEKSYEFKNHDKIC